MFAWGRKNIKKYSEFIDYHIYMKINKTYTEGEEIEEEENEMVIDVDTGELLV